MSSRRAFGTPDALRVFDVFDSKGTVFGTASQSSCKSHYIYMQPHELQGRRVTAPFYVSSHPRPPAKPFKEVCMRALLTR